MIELKIRLKSPQISIKNGLIPETHSSFAPGNHSNETEDYGVKFPANNVRCTISPWSLLGFIRSGFTDALIEKGVSVCHGYDLNLPKGDYEEFVKQDLVYGFHRKAFKSGKTIKGVAKPECEVVMDKKCLVAEMFGTFAGDHRVFSVMPVKTTPIKNDYKNRVRGVTGMGNYQQIAISPRSAVDGTPYATHTISVLEHVDAIMYIRMYEPNPRMSIHIAALLNGFDYKNTHKDEFKHQLGGGRTFGSGFVDTTVLPISMSRDEITEYHLRLIAFEDKADDNNGFTKDAQAKIDGWEAEKARYAEIFTEELKVQKEQFGIDKKWWQTN